jgi:Asp-tRNA(Asn)/Glu-tRNA(Gln) amidotransferase A subunit family amidase
MSAAGWVRKAVEAYPHLVPFNMSGTPAMSVPSGLDDHGVPIGIQLAARMNDEAALFRVAAQLEAARLAATRPAIHVGRTAALTGP